MEEKKRGEVQRSSGEPKWRWVQCAVKRAMKSRHSQWGREAKRAQNKRCRVHWGEKDSQSFEPWIASALLPVCVECSDEIKIWSSVVAVSTIDASWQSVNDDADDARNDDAREYESCRTRASSKKHDELKDAKWSHEHRWVAESHKSKDAMNKMKWESWCSEAQDSHLEEYFHLAFINRSILRTKPMDTAGLKVL